MAEITHNEEHHTDHAHNDTVVFMGRAITVEGGIYTVIFGLLAVLTIIEVIVAQVIDGMIESTPDVGFLVSMKAFILLGLAIIKATLVVLFYMHLKDENRLLAIVLLLPLLIAALSVMFVLSVPPTGYTL